jgi:hypothetical protein
MGGWSTKGVTCRVKPKVESFTGTMAHKRWSQGRPDSGKSHCPYFISLKE